MAPPLWLAFSAHRRHGQARVLFGLLFCFSNAINTTLTLKEKRDTTVTASQGSLTLATHEPLSATFTTSPKGTRSRTTFSSNGLAPATWTVPPLTVTTGPSAAMTGLLIALIVLCSLLLLCALTWLLLKLRRRRRKARNTQNSEVEELGRHRQAGTSEIVRGDVPRDTLTHTSLHAPPSSALPPALHQKSPSGRGGDTQRPHPVGSSLRRERKPEPLQIQRQQPAALPPTICVTSDSAEAISARAFATGYSPALEDARRRLQEQQTWSQSPQRNATSPSKTASIAAALAASSRAFGMQSNSPPFTGVPRGREVPQQDGTLEDAHSTIASLDHLPHASAAHHRSSFGVITPDISPFVPASPRAPSSDENDSPSTPRPILCSPSRYKPGSISCHSPLPTGRNSFGVEEDKGEENEPSGAPELAVANRILKDAQHGDGSSKPRAGTPSSGSHYSQSRTTGPLTTSLSPLATPTQKSTSSLSLQSSMARAERWLGETASSSAAIGYTLA